MTSFPRWCLLLALVAGPALAKETTDPETDAAIAELQSLVAEVGEEKRAFFGEQLALTEAEAAKFWPVYDGHQAALEALNERRLKNIIAYADFWNARSTDEKAAEAIAREAMDIEKDEAALMEHTYGKLKRAVPVLKAIRYLQMESKLRALVRVQLAARIPLAR